MAQRTFTIHPPADPEASERPAPLVLHCDHISRANAFVALGMNDIAIIGQLANSSNGALLGEIETSDAKISVVVKPSMYENPLYDFEWGTLAKREVAACEMSELLGWDLVPPTVLRDVSEMEASVQLFIPHDPREHYFTLSASNRDVIEKFAVFDYIVNNADRKGGHILAEKQDSFELFLDTDSGADDGDAARLHAVPTQRRLGDVPSSSTSTLWGIDHGLTFHVEDKLRTVIWEFSEEAISEALLIDVNAALPKIKERLAPLLSAYEVEKTIERVEKLLINPYHHALDANTRAFPWPLV